MRADETTGRGWVVVPYDGGPAAHAALRRAAAVAGRLSPSYRGLVVATVGLEPAALEGPLTEAAARAGRAVPIAVARLDAADPVGALRRMVEGAPGATLALPLGGRARAPWYAAVRRAADIDAATMLFFFSPGELRAAAATAPARPRGPLGALGRALRRLLRRGAGAAPGGASPRYPRRAGGRARAVPARERARDATHTTPDATSRAGERRGEGRG